MYIVGTIWISTILPIPYIQLAVVDGNRTTIILSIVNSSVVQGKLS